jgi:hypothetical protein
MWAGAVTLPEHPRRWEFRGIHYMELKGKY